MGALLGKSGGVKKALERVPLSMGASLGNLGEGSYAEGLCVKEGFGMGVSLYRGPIGGPGEGEL
jgi:hypothetical protein